MERLKGLDSLRFICAMTVVIDHYGLPVPEFVTSLHSPLGKVLNGLVGCLFNGPAAVIVFFVISGFCIHFPFRNLSPIYLYSYYSRRIIRIGLPALVAIALYNQLGLKLEPPVYWVFWSIICELIYYTIYPLFLVARRRYTWESIIAVAYASSLLLAIGYLDIIQKSYNVYVALGLLTWVIALPCWLLGCWLAENYRRFQHITTKQIWLIRSGIFSTSVVIKIAVFHVDSVFASSIFTLNMFAFLVTIWLGFEIAYFQVKSTVSVLEWSGRWSYSLYIIHPIVPALTILAGLEIQSAFMLKLLWIILALCIAYSFFLLIEKPSHTLAAYVDRRLKKMSSIVVGRPIPKG